MNEPKQADIEARRAALLSAASAYAIACDEGNYPALHMRAKDLKMAARRLRWAEQGIEGDPRPSPTSRASRILVESGRSR